MNWAVWASFATISAANIVTPGPANLNTLRRALQLGGRRVTPTILGNALGLAVGGAICALGIISAVIAFDFLLPFCRLIGVTYLIWLALKLLLKSETLLMEPGPKVPVSFATLFGEAFLLAVTNPKALLFYMALFPQVLDLNRALTPQVSILLLTYSGLSIMSLSTYAVFANALRKRYMTQKRYTRFRQISGLILLGFALKLLLDTA
ncbi:LysE family translocator [Shimia sp. MMG029]|uniref:LysE family translocator n=1 Tax=Shimia sp. MMG029 TaxID=3021978 RepID=UPI0022FE50C5|nr:LysE family translocator [Shimia sp. MMG029]MDA5557002.1 LysE family translocator [Shimia sp. MMG029]